MPKPIQQIVGARLAVMVTLDDGRELELASPLGNADETLAYAYFQMCKPRRLVMIDGKIEMLLEPRY